MRSIQMLKLMVKPGRWLGGARGGSDLTRSPRRAAASCAGVHFTWQQTCFEHAPGGMPIVVLIFNRLRSLIVHQS
jgi:hypothetical protein